MSSRPVPHPPARLRRVLLHLQQQGIEAGWDDTLGVWRAECPDCGSASLVCAAEALAELRRAGARLEEDGRLIHYNAPASLPDGLHARAIQHRDLILLILQREREECGG